MSVLHDDGLPHLLLQITPDEVRPSLRAEPGVTCQTRVVLMVRTANFEPALSEIDIATWSPGVTPAPPRDPSSPFFGGRSDPGDVLVAESEGETRGYLMFHQSIPLPSHSHVLQINGLAVHPEHQGQGIGRFLVEKAKCVAQRRGVRKLSLRVLSPNVSARRLYEGCGFVVEGVLRDEFVREGELVDDVLMACHLAADSTRA
jgi:GNAT superfamily N-acetyltransferase